jgi:hypothetical protein
MIIGVQKNYVLTQIAEMLIEYLFLLILLIAINVAI